MNLLVEKGDLVGRWSEDALYNPAAQSDYGLYFRSDGLGCLAYEIAFPSEVEPFRWTFREGLLAMKSLGVYLLGNDLETPKLELPIGDLHFGPSLATIELERTPVYGTLPVLSVPAIPATGGYPNRFARVDGDLPDWVQVFLDRHTTGTTH